MLTNVLEYDYINRLTFHMMYSLILCPLAKNSLSGNSVNSFRLKVLIFSQIVRSKSKKVKNDLKLNVMFTLFVQFLVENRIFTNYLPFN